MRRGTLQKRTTPAQFYLSGRILFWGTWANFVSKYRWIP